MNTEVVREFFDSWDLYDRVMDHGYMFHDELYRHVAACLGKRFGTNPFSILDLGCGSARHLAPALQGLSIRSYTGCDISDVALGLAGENLAPLGCPLEFIQTDLLKSIETGSECYDLVFSSFALHHLNPQGKQRFFEEAHRRLAPNGSLLLIDVARRENQDQATYLDEYCGWIQADWKKLSQIDLDFIFDHIRNNDYPETQLDLEQMAANAAFRGGIVRSELWHHLWQFDPA